MPTPPGMSYQEIGWFRRLRQSASCGADHQGFLHQSFTFHGWMRIPILSEAEEAGQAKVRIRKGKVRGDLPIRVCKGLHCCVIVVRVSALSACVVIARAQAEVESKLHGDDRHFPGPTPRP